MKRKTNIILLFFILLVNLSFNSSFQMILKSLPKSNDVIVLRTDFTNDNSWVNVCKKIQTPDKQFGYLAYVEFLDDSLYNYYSVEEMLKDTSMQYNYSFVFIVDSTTISNPENPILCVGLKRNRGKHFRVIPSEMWGVENNLSISNMDFEEFSNSVDPDGIFRGFENKQR